MSEEENETDESTTLTVPISPMLTVTPEQIKDFQKNFSLLKKSILKRGIDYTIEEIGGKPQTVFHRSGWEKIAFIFKISTEIIGTKYREYERHALRIFRHPDTNKIVKKEPMFDKEGNPLLQKHYAYEVTIKAFCGDIINDAVGACSTDEGKTFHHPMHDVYATAHTRAKGRGICAVVGGGLSYEEIADVNQIKRQEQKQITRETTKAPIRTR